MHDITTVQPLPCELVDLRPQMQQVLTAVLAPEASTAAEAGSGPSGRGRPREISEAHLWLSLLSSVVLGMSCYPDWWRLVYTTVLGPFLPVQLSVDALTKRLQQAGLAPLQRIAAQVSAYCSPRLATLPTTALAPFATEMVALDETTLDAVSRWLVPLRRLPKGDLGLLAGKLAARFTIRTQQWDLLQYRCHVQANCKVQILTLLDGLARGSLILFDLGYFSFPWFDSLTQQGYWYISRLREKTTSRLLHTYYRHEGILDALVWLGSPKGARAGYAVRLVRFHDGKGLRTYLTTVLDPRQLSMVDIAQLYARSFDIELAFLTLKEHLGLHHWWSSKQSLILQQIWAVLIIAQLFQALRLDIAAAAQVDPFEVSLPLLVKYVPQLIRQCQKPIDWILTYGKPLGLIRPASRLQVSAPAIALAQMAFPPPDLVLVRKACYIEYQPRPSRPSYNKKKKKGAKASNKTNDHDHLTNDLVGGNVPCGRPGGGLRHRPSPSSCVLTKPASAPTQLSPKEPFRHPHSAG